MCLSKFQWNSSVPIRTGCGHTDASSVRPYVASSTSMVPDAQLRVPVLPSHARSICSGPACSHTTNTRTESVSTEPTCLTFLGGIFHLAYFATVPHTALKLLNVIWHPIKSSFTQLQIYVRFWFQTWNQMLLPESSQPISNGIKTVVQTTHGE